MAVPTLDASLGSTSGAAATSHTVTKVSGVAAGQLLIIIIAADLTNAVGDEFSTPTGWTKIDEHSPGGSSDASVAAYWREASGDSGDDAPTITWTTAAEAVAWYIRCSGADTTSPIDGVSTPVTVNSSVTHAITGLTTSVDECLAFYCLAFDGGDGLPFTVAGTGWSETDERQYDTDPGTISACFGTKDQTSAGATGTATVTSAVADGSASFQFAIAPSGGASSGVNRSLTLLGIG